jgi:hypothetical protein
VIKLSARKAVKLTPKTRKEIASRSIAGLAKFKEGTQRLRPAAIGAEIKRQVKGHKASAKA